MSYQERSNLISLATTLLISIPYSFFVFNRYRAESFVTTTDELVFWASTILILVPIRIVSEIVMHILAAIVTAIINQKEEKAITDERDSLIELKGTRNSMYIYMFCTLISMAVIVNSQSVASMFAVLLIGGFFSEVVGIFSKIYYYKRGI